MRSEGADIIGSPFKRHRASVPGLGNDMLGALASSTSDSYPVSALAAGHKDDSFHAGSTPEPSSMPETKIDNNNNHKADSDEEL